MTSPRKRTRLRVDGVLLLDKPSGMTSNGALQSAKRMLQAVKAGHAGTLDPLASGLLPLLFGEATKFARFALDSDKTYLAAVRLGSRTTTGDADGEVLERKPVAFEDAALERALAAFRGAIEQVPPMYSALKREGKPLYELARAGQIVERAPRSVLIHELSLLERHDDLLQLRVRCSKGTYVRQLAEDLGAALGCGGHLEALRRVEAGGYGIEQAIDFDRLEALDPAARAAQLHPAESLLAGLPAFQLPAPDSRRFVQGQAVTAPQAAGGYYQVRGDAGALLGVGQSAADGKLHPVRLLQAAEIARKTC